METSDAFPEPPRDPPGVEELYRQGRDALTRQVWEAAASRFKAALALSPDDARLHLALARAYQGQARGKDGAPFLRLAWDHSLAALKAAPDSAEALDALLALSARVDRLDEVLAELRSRLRAEPDDEARRAAVRKVETLLALRIPNAGAAVRARPGFGRFLADVALPGLALLSLAGSFFLRGSQDAIAARFSPLLFRGGVFLAGVYLAYRFIARRWL